MKKPLKFCCNGDGRPVQPPSWVLCAECLRKMGEKFHKLSEQFKKKK